MTRSLLFTYLGHRNDDIVSARSTPPHEAADGVAKSRPIEFDGSAMSRPDTIFAWAAVAVLVAVIAFILGATFIS